MAAQSLKVMISTSKFPEFQFYCATIVYHVELNADFGWPTSKKNRHLVLAGASQEGEPRSEIPPDPPSFSLATIVAHTFYCKERNLIFSCGYTCR